MENENLERMVWSEDDFEIMQWHDCEIYAIAFNEDRFELAFDIDYILKWVDPVDGESNYRFWVIPATLVFRNVYEININASSLELQVQGIYRANPTFPKNVNIGSDEIEYDWTIETSSGQIAFKSVGYKQFAKGEPKLIGKQSIGLAERGGISFDVLPSTGSI